MILQIKYMVSLRCVDLVRAILDRLNIAHGGVSVGTVELAKALTRVQRKAFSIALKKFGFELFDQHKDKLIENINKAIKDIVEKPIKLLKAKHSVYIARKLNYDYTYLANIFSEVTGTTIEHTIINLKVDKAKEFLLYNELTLRQISFKLDYSSVAHLCKQFKKVTGLTPTFFKNMKKGRMILIATV